MFNFEFTRPLNSSLFLAPCTHMHDQEDSSESSTPARYESAANPIAAAAAAAAATAAEVDDKEKAAKKGGKKEEFASPILRQKGRASLFRSFVLADYVTMGNAVCGSGVMFFCLNYLDNNKRDVYLVSAFFLNFLGLCTCMERTCTYLFSIPCVVAIFFGSGRHPITLPDAHSVEINAS